MAFFYSGKVIECDTKRMGLFINTHMCIILPRRHLGANTNPTRNFKSTGAAIRMFD